MIELFLTVEQTAARLQVQPITVRRHLRSGLLRGIKRGNLWRVPESALQEAPIAAPPALTALLTKKPMTPHRRAAIEAVTGALKDPAQKGWQDGLWDIMEEERRADIEREDARDLI